MLIGRDNPGFPRGGPAALLDDPRCIDPEFFEQAEKNLSVSAGADHPSDGHFSTQRHNVVHDIAGAPQGKVLVPDGDHLYRGFGRYPVDISPEVFVEHQVSGHQEVASVKF